MGKKQISDVWQYITFWYYTFIFVIPVYFLLLHIQEIGRADNFPIVLYRI